MRRAHGDAVFVTEVLSDNAEGWIGVSLAREQRGARTALGRVTYGDASGQLSNSVGAETPLVVVGEAIREARQRAPGRYRARPRRLAARPTSPATSSTARAGPM